MPRFYRISAIILSIWLVCWIYISWPSSIDDALIHLRYADFLHRQHIISYDGIHRSYGTSSLLYVSILAFLRSFTLSPVLPRAISSISHLILFAVVAIGLDRALRKRSAAASSTTGNSDRPALWLLAIALLVALVSPSAVRWLNDGLETSLTLVFVVIAVWLLRRTLRQGAQASTALVAAFFLFAFLMELLRVELLVFAGLLSLIAWLDAKIPVQASLPGRLRLTPSVLAPLAGALAGALLILLTMHSLIPDTAIAKSMGLAHWRDTLGATVITTASSFSFGLGLCALWVASFAAVAVFCRRLRLSDFAANALFPTVVALAAIRGQQVQGIRYFAWALLFSVLWNLLRASDAGPAASPRLLTMGTAFILLAVVAAQPFEARLVYRVLSQRGKTLRTMQAEHLELLEGRVLLAEDVGFIGYFTRAQICDPDGLVNGREAAKLNYQQRFSACIAQRPLLVYGNSEFLQKTSAAMDMSAWSVCGQYRFDNVSTPDIHYLVAAPSVAALACRATGNAAQPFPAAANGRSAG